MRRRLLGVTFGLAVAVVTGCYRPPMPECGFICGPGASCPNDYQCSAADGRCHRNGTSATLACPSALDAAVSWDAPEGGDTVRPTLLSILPFENEANVSVAPDVSMLFSEDVFNVNGTSIFVEQGLAPVAGSISYFVFAHQASWTPSAQLSANVTYTVTVLSSITDLAGNPFEGFGWSFTTGADLVSPSIVTTAPLPDDTNVSVDAAITILFDEPVTNVDTTTFTVDQGGTPIAGLITIGSGSLSATFTPTLPLPPTTLFTVTLTAAIADAAGNTLAPLTYTFTTGI